MYNEGAYSVLMPTDFMKRFSLGLGPTPQIYLPTDKHTRRVNIYILIQFPQKALTCAQEGFMWGVAVI